MRITLATILLLLLCGPAFAQSAGSPARPPKKKVTPRPPLTAVQEKQALKFARQHHPGLARLVERLGIAKQKRQYRRAVSELFRTFERLDRVRKSDPERHKSLLGMWQLDSQARLLLAQSMMRPDPQLDKRLKETLRKRAVLKRQMLTRDRERSRVRIEKLETQLRSLDDLDAAAERELQRLKKSTRVKLSKRQKRKNKNASKTQPAKSVLPARKRSDRANQKDRSTP